MTELNEETIARALYEHGSSPKLYAWEAAHESEKEHSRGYARAVLALVLPAIERARVEERERAALACEDQMPATQDMESTEICEALERAAAAIRKG